MNGWKILVAAVCLGVGAIAGCEDAPQLPIVVQPPTPQDVAAPRPTTQQLLEGPRQTLALGELPLTVRAPAAWAVKPMEGDHSHILLQGPTPSGDAFVQLNVRPNTPAAKFDVIVSGAKKELQQFPQSIKLVDVRTIDGAKVLERQRVGQVPRPLPDDPPDLKPSAPFNWTITVFAPRGPDYETYELNFVGLTADQYEMDKALLRGIIESIALTTAPADSPAPTTHSTPATAPTRPAAR